MSSRYPFRASAVLAAAALAAVALLAPASAPAQGAGAVPGEARPEAARPAETAAAVAGGGAAGPSNPAQKNIAARAVDKVRDIFARVPCLPPKGAGSKSTGSLPHVANRLIAGQPVTIIAFGSSSTQGYGASAPEYNYPNRLAAQLRRQYPTADITVLNRGKGGEDAPEMMRRLQAEVIDMKPDLVIWQVGTNAVLRNLDQAETARLVDEGIARIQAAGSDVVLVDSQYSPAVNARSEGNSRMMKLLGKVAELRKIGVFPRFEVMRDWHEKQAIPVEEFIISDGLHMSDWGYACFAQLLADDIIKSVGQIKLGVAVPSDVRAYRPM